MLLIFALSNEPASLSSARSGAIVQAIEKLDVGLSEQVLTFLTRKAAHIVAYFVLGLLMFNAIRGYKWERKYLVLASIAFCCLYAVSDEVHQIFVPGRSGEVRDVLIDTAASGAGVAVYWVVSQSCLKSKNNV